jgi:hypothetical protein
MAAVEATRYGADRVPWESAETLLHAFEKALTDQSMLPLEPMLRATELHTLAVKRERKFRFFGKEVLRIPKASVVLGAALQRYRLETVDLDVTPMSLAATLRGDPAHANARAAILELFANDHGLPGWMAGDEGPSLLSPTDVKRLVDVLESVREQWGAAHAIDAMSALVAMARRCTTTEGIVIRG